MDNCDIQLVGGPCGQHGPYTFYKAFKYTKNGFTRIVTLSEFFFVKLWIDSDLLCIGELQLLWSDKNSDQVLASLRLYFLPENTPEGRMDHGEDEVLAIAEKVVLKVEDLITWITVDAEWTWGRLAKCESDINEPPKSEERKNGILGPLTETSLDFSDVEKERQNIDCTRNHEGPLVVILSYPRYCRYRAMMRRLEGVENDYLKYKIVNALGGFTAGTKNTRVLFCKETFDYPELEGHELLCNHLAPKLKGRPRGKRKKRSVSPGSESNESESSVYNAYSGGSSKDKSNSDDGSNGIRCDLNLRRSTRSVENNESRDFLKELSTFMKTNYTPIGKIPSLGYKELDLYTFYAKVQKLGGYDTVTSNRLWKSIFDEMNGHANSTSAATVIRRHYERFLLPYERHVKGEEHKPLPISERRRLKSKTGSTASDAETSESTSRSGNSTPVPQSNSSPTTPTTPTENKEFNLQVKPEGSTKSSSSSSSSSLRSVRVKTERQKDKQVSPLSGDIKTEPEPEISPEEISPSANNTVKIESRTLEDSSSTSPSPVKVEKDAEPVTSAVAPVAQKLSPDEKTLSPVEAKENIPLLVKTGDTPGDIDAESNEVPYKPVNPAAPDGGDVVEPNNGSGSAASSSNVTPFLHEVKKRKLDILKEGGLEVTPVKNALPQNTSKGDSRPSVIQQIGAQNPNPIPNPPLYPNKEMNNMPPPILPAAKRLHIPQSLGQTGEKSRSPHKPFIGFNGVPPTPPKVVQSKSIYSYSEKTIYGNPKDFMVPPAPPVMTPKLAEPRHSGGDILDLTVSSPQKPVVEIMKIPNVMPPQMASLTTKNPFVPNKTPLLDGRRIGSNLEITLVGSGKMEPPHLVPNKYTPHHTIPSYPYPSNKYPQKRGSHQDSMYPPQKMQRIDESMSNGKYAASKTFTMPTSLPPQNKMKTSGDLAGYSRGGSKSESSNRQQNAKHYAASASAPAPGVPFPYLPQLYDGTKGLSPYLPMLDPIYYSAALQNMYSHNMGAAAPPVFPQMPTPDQMKYYSELMSMAHSSRMNYPIFPLGPDTANPSNSFKKP